MATHGRIGIDLERYHARKLRPHRVSGVYVADGATSRPQVMVLSAYLRKKRLVGSHASKRKGDADAGPKSRVAGGITHYRPFYCEGRAARKAVQS